MPVFLLIKRPFFACLFIKMSPSEQLGTLDSASKRTYGKKQIIAIHKAMDANPRLTASQVKLQLPKVLAGVAPWTIRRIISEELDIPSRVPPKKPFVTEALIKGRLEWATDHRLFFFLIVN